MPTNTLKLVLILAAALLGGCSNPDVLVNDRVGLSPSRGSAADVEGIDGLTVGHRLMEAGEFELALKAYYRAASEIGVNVDVLSALGSANLRLGRLNQAEELLREAVKRDPKFIPALNNLGVVLNAKNEFGEARELFRVAYALDSGNSDEIRDNLRRLDQKLQNNGAETGEDYDFRLVRRGNGQYLLLGQ